MTTTAVITMAGFGRRFLDAGYGVPKYRIEVHGRSLFAWSMLSLESFIEGGTSFVFVARAAEGSADFIRNEATGLGIGRIDIVELATPTDGQATTVLAAQAAVADRSAPFLIYNIDTFVHPGAMTPAQVRGDGWIPCFRAEGDAWSFAAADDTGLVCEVREKRRISPHATVGLYWFSSFTLYEDAYRRYYADSANLERGERYVAPVYNALIADGRAVYISEIEPSAVVPLGVPADVERFRAGAPPLQA
jgi:dTDP-glucose pyrophosphorylase